MNAISLPALPADWTLSEPTPFIHGHWFATFYRGQRMSLVLLNCGNLDWRIQGREFLRFDSAAAAINYAVCVALKKSGQIGWSLPDYHAD